MHVVQLGPYPPPEGGISRHIIALRSVLAADGDRCSIIATSKSSEAKIEPDVYHPRSPFQLFRLLRSIRADIVHVHIGGNVGPRVLAMALVTTKIFGRRSVLTIHSGAFPSSRAARAARWISFAGLVFRRFGRIIALNAALEDAFERFRVEPARICRIAPHALSPPDPSVTLPRELAAFFDAHSPVLLSVGGLEAEYDPLFQIGAMKDLRKDLPKVGLLFVGDGSMREEASNAAERSGLTDSIMFCGDVEHALTLHLIDRADALIRTTLFDGDSIAVREAMFLGTPVVATDTGMRPDGVGLYPVGDRGRFLATVGQVLETKGAHQARCPADTFNIQRVIEVYRELA